MSISKGWKVALEKIALEKVAKTGKLDLGRLGLTNLPFELFELEHLERLFLGSWVRSKDSLWVKSNLDILPNSISKDLAKLYLLPNLIQLSLSNCILYSLAPIRHLKALQHFDCIGTKVDDLLPLINMENLQTLDCSDTLVSDIKPLEKLNSLKNIFLWNTQINTIPESFVRLPKLEHLIISGPQLSSTFAELVSKDWEDNCLERLRAHFDDLAYKKPKSLNKKELDSDAHLILSDSNGSDGERLTDLKLIVIGNGQVGKSQICRRLRGEKYDANLDPTHGIEVHTIQVLADDPTTGEELQTNLHIWDFGGQDLYHGSHLLFLKSRAVFIIVWDRISEENDHKAHGFPFKNHKLPYWVEIVSLYASTNPSMLVVQNKCDTVADVRPVPPVNQDLLNKFQGSLHILNYSALRNTSTQFNRLKTEISQAISQYWQNHGIPRIGIGRLNVKSLIESLISVPSEQRRRTISINEFKTMCREAGGISNETAFLEYLDSAGVVIYRPNLFGERIIIDHNWVFDAIYAVTDIKHTYNKIRNNRGRFVQSDLQKSWQKYNQADQDLFLALMQSCGIAFIYKLGDNENDIETEYIAPELLPELQDAAGDFSHWQGYREQIHGFDVILPFLHPGLIQSLICKVGELAHNNATYAKTGLCFKDLKTNSLCRIEQVKDENKTRYSGRLEVRTRAGDARQLLALIHQWLERILTEHLGHNTGWEIKPVDRMPGLAEKPYRQAFDPLNEGKNPMSEIEFTPQRTALLTESEWQRVRDIMSRISFNSEVSRRSLIIDMKLNTGMSPWAGLIQIHATHDFIIQLMHEIQIPKEPLIEYNLMQAILNRTTNLNDKHWLEQKLQASGAQRPDPRRGHPPARPEDWRPEDRNILIDELGELTQADFELFVMKYHPKHKPAKPSSIVSMVTEFILWAESIRGPEHKLFQVRQNLNEFCKRS